MKASDDNIQVLDVWDSGKGTICRISLKKDERVTAFLQSRLTDKNCLFVCIKGIDQTNNHTPYHELRTYEIGKDGQTCDHEMVVDLTTPSMLTATNIFIGADALYINMSSRELYKLEILQEILQKEMDDYVVIEHRLTNYMAFDLGEDNGSASVTQMFELENQNEALQRSGYSDDLVCVIFADCTIKVYDTVNGELVRDLNELPAPFYHNNLTQCEVMEAAVKGDQLVIIAELALSGQNFRGPVLLYLDERLEYCIRAQLHMPQESVGALCTASIYDQETVDIVTNQHVTSHEY